MSVYFMDAKMEGNVNRYGMPVQQQQQQTIKTRHLQG